MTKIVSIRCIAKLFLNSLYGKLLSKINEGD